jgi:DNA primase
MTGRIPQQFIDDLVARADIVDIIDARVPLKKAGREFIACCPFHSEKTPSFTVSPAKQFYHCFGCGAHRTVIGFLMDYEHLDFVEAVEELARQAGVEVPREFSGEGRDAPAARQLYGVLEEAARYYQQQLRQHASAARAVDYLKARGLSGQIAQDFGIGYAPPGWDNLLGAMGRGEDKRHLLQLAGLVIARSGGGLYDRFRDRVMFPIRDRRGRVIAFGGRVLGDETPKYLNSPESPVFHKGRELYGLFEARKAERQLDRLLVVEGYMDVVALAQYGMRNVVATLGTATTVEHLERLYRVVPEVVFCFDGDRAGRAAARRALEQALPIMREGRQARFLFLPEGDDPDSLVRREGREAFASRTADSLPFSEFFFETLLGNVDISHMDGRARLVELARPLLSNLPAGVFRDLMTDRLAQLAEMDPLRLRRFGGEPAIATTGVASRKPPERGQRRPVREAITLLLHKPELARLPVSPRQLARVELKGIPLLVELLEFLRNQPHIGSIGAVMEHFRDREEARYLWRLAQTPLNIPEPGMTEEFEGIIQLLKAHGDEGRWHRLQAKLERDGNLSGEELEEWKSLLNRSKR